MMSRSGAGIPTAGRNGHAVGEAAPSAYWSERQSDVPTRGRDHRGGTTQRESASRCVPVRACALPNNISTASPALLFHPIHASRTLSSFLSSSSFLCMYVYIYTSLLPRSLALLFSFYYVVVGILVSREAFALRSPSSALSDPSDLATKAREEKNHAAEQHVCCTRADRQSARGYSHRRSLLCRSGRAASIVDVVS